MSAFRIPSRAQFGNQMLVAPQSSQRSPNSNSVALRSGRRRHRRDRDSPHQKNECFQGIQISGADRMDSESIHIPSSRNARNEEPSQTHLVALRSRKCNRTVMRWNIRRMLQQRLVATEMEEMYMARKESLAEHQAVRPLLVISHTQRTLVPVRT